MSIDAMKQALAYIKATNKSSSFWLVPASELNKTVTALHLAIEQADRQEPVCDKDPRGCWNVRCQLGKVCKNAAPPQRQPLQVDKDGWYWVSENECISVDLIRKVERAHGIGDGE